VRFEGSSFFELGAVAALSDPGRFVRQSVALTTLTVAVSPDGSRLKSKLVTRLAMRLMGVDVSEVARMKFHDMSDWSRLLKVMGVAARFPHTTVLDLVVKVNRIRKRPMQELIEDAMRPKHALRVASDLNGAIFLLFRAHPFPTARRSNANLCKEKSQRLVRKADAITQHRWLHATRNLQFLESRHAAILG
jgi:hypothetical protein